MGNRRIDTFKCYKIFNQIYEVPTIKIYKIRDKTEICRNVIPTYVSNMYARGIMRGPFLFMRATPEYKEYLYLMNFQDPFSTIEGLKEFPHVVYARMAAGDWNVVVITDRLLDLSQLVGAEDMVFQTIVYCRKTPKVLYTPWEKSFAAIHQKIEMFSPVQKTENCRVSPSLYWGEDEWALYQIFKTNLRKKVISSLRENRIRYDTFTKWKNTLHNYCTVNTEFYPAGYYEYARYSFLFSTDYPEKVKSVFSELPATPIFLELDNHLFAILSVVSPGCIKALFRSVFFMKAKKMINEFKTAVMLHYENGGCDGYW